MYSKELSETTAQDIQTFLNEMKELGFTFKLTDEQLIERWELQCYPVFDGELKYRGSELTFHVSFSKEERSSGYISSCFSKRNPTCRVNSIEGFVARVKRAKATFIERADNNSDRIQKTKESHNAIKSELVEVFGEESVESHNNVLYRDQELHFLKGKCKLSIGAIMGESAKDKMLSPAQAKMAVDFMLDTLMAA